jgi:Type II CAAX prenyl endopeptidase Rce1-like
MAKISFRILTLVEALGLAVYIAWYIWQLQATKPNSWIVLMAWLVLSLVFHQDTPKTLGWRADNLGPATRQGLPVFIFCVVAAIPLGWWFGAFHTLPPHLIQMRHVLNYAAFCLLQQVALNSYMTNRLLYAFEARWPAALVAGTVFGALHCPNPVLVPLTFLGGVVMSWLFARERNIIPLAIGQAIVGTLIWWAFPVAWHHGMRVGPGYYTFHLK